MHWFKSVYVLNQLNLQKNKIAEHASGRGGILSSTRDFTRYIFILSREKQNFLESYDAVTFHGIQGSIRFRASLPMIDNYSLNSKNIYVWSLVSRGISPVTIYPFPQK